MRFLKLCEITLEMNRKQLLGPKKSILCCLLLLWFSQMALVYTHDSFDRLNDREIEPPFVNSGVGDRQSAFKKALHEHLTHAELKNEQESDEEQTTHHRDEEQHHDDYTSPKQNQHHEEEKKRTLYDDHQNADHSEEEEEEERTYDPWHDSFQDIFEDGTYAYGYNLPNGVTRYERSFYSDKYKGRVVEGFYTQPRHFGKRVLYELRCYRSDYYNGHRPLGVQYLRRQPIVQRDTEPDVDCFDRH